MKPKKNQSADERDEVRRQISERMKRRRKVKHFLVKLLAEHGILAWSNTMMVGDAHINGVLQFFIRTDTIDKLPEPEPPEKHPFVTADYAASDICHECGLSADAEEHRP